MLVRLAHHLRLMYFFVRRPLLRGVRAIALTPDNQVILVRHSYGSRAWMLPGGGQGRDTAVDAILKELREEIGMHAFAEVQHFGDFMGRLGHADDAISVFVVRGVLHRPVAQSWLWREIESVQAFPLHALPPDMSPATTRRLAELAGDRPISSKW